MTHRTATLLTCLAAATLITAPVNAQTLDLDPIAGGLGRLVGGGVAPGRPGEFFAIDARQSATGSIWIVDLPTGSVNPTPFLQVSGVSTGGEQGLLGLAFDPDFQSNGKLYVNYTDGDGTTIVQRFAVSPDDPDQAQPDGPDNIILELSQPAANHNGGWMTFGPDDQLYIATGDGGGSFNQYDTAQDINDLHGKLLRIDPSRTGNGYSSPADNPFVGQAGADEIWAYGLRNPWRNSFDSETGDLWIADVGQNSREEINSQPDTSTGGENYGWDYKEGELVLETPVPADVVDPIYQYDHSVGQSITGGYVYRGELLDSEMVGRYFFADFITGRVWSLEYDGSDVVDVMEHTADLIPDGQNGIGNISSFAEGADGELYLMTIDGNLYQIVPEPATMLLLAGGGLAILRRRR
ncbi:MAG: PQQ-dependent sugar dehydrogenase [Phycisphaerae bacterium]